MYKYRYTLTVLCLALIVALFLPSQPAQAQNGRWVAYSLIDFGSGDKLYDRGDGLNIYTRGTCDKIAIFDIEVGEWQTVDLGQNENFAKVDNDGKVAFAYSDNLIFGYSARTQTWDTVYYAGTVLNTDYQYGYHSYGCSRELAFFATDEYFYVFDATVGEWVSYPFSLPVDYASASGRFYAKDDYIVLRLGRTESYASPKMYVYSAVLREFNWTDNGCSIYTPVMDHGFAALQAHDGTGKNFTAVAWSVVNNEFNTVGITLEDNQSISSTFLNTSMKADQFTTYAFGVRTLVTPSELATCRWWGYDTRLGTWSSVYHEFDWTEESYYASSGYRGGQYGVDFSLNKEAMFHLFLYNGIDGSFTSYWPGIRWESTVTAFARGGSVYMMADDETAWGYDAGNVRYNGLLLSNETSKNVYSGEDWVTLSRLSSGDDHMIVIFYNSSTNSWSVRTMPYDISTNPVYSAHTYSYYDYNSGELLYYNSYHDRITKKFFTPETSVIISLRGAMGLARSDNLSVIFDGHNDTDHSYDFEWNGSGLGTHSVVSFDEAANTMYGYSAYTGNTTSLYTDDWLYSVADTGYIGLVTIQNEYNIVNGCHAFNGLADNWVKLEPEGYGLSIILGEKTALVITHTNTMGTTPLIMYAFDPQRQSTGIADDDDVDNILPDRFVLEQNHPNPFNPATVIDYSLPHKADVTLEIYNLLGQKVKTLISDNQPAGSHSVAWDGTDEAGYPVASGIYFYQLKADGYTRSKKMLLLK